MKITIKKTIETEIEVPQYWTCHNGYSVFKLLDNEKCYQVLAYPKWPMIAISSVKTNFELSSTAITEEEFNLRLNEAKQFLNL
jgi:hypothetical protein